MSTTLRLMTLRLLKKLGVKRFRAQSGVKQPFVCHIGDSLGENPFYNPASCVEEIVLMAAWCHQFENPVVFDIGGHVGFIATQLAQLIKYKEPKIYSFEPSLLTFQKLVETIRLLNLGANIFPICCALSDKCGLVRLSYSEWDSMLAQVVVGELNRRAGDKVVWANALTLDSAAAGIEELPHLVKVDVEGHEINVFRGGSNLLNEQERPAFQFELNPVTLREAGIGGHELAKQLDRYNFYFVNEVEGQQDVSLKFGQSVQNLDDIQWVVNIFAVPDNEASQKRWQLTLSKAEEIFHFLHTKPAN